MSRAGKGTVQRRFTIEKYSAELDVLYADADRLRDCEAIVEFPGNVEHIVCVSCRGIHNWHSRR